MKEKREEEGEEEREKRKKKVFWSIYLGRERNKRGGTGRREKTRH